MPVREELCERLKISNEQLNEMIEKRKKDNPGSTATSILIAMKKELDGQKTMTLDNVGNTVENTSKLDFGFHEAKRTDAYMKIAIEGVSGSGKTYSSILLAKTLAQGGKIAFIDTENNSASLYSHLAKFDVLNLKPPYSPDRYIQAIKMAEEKGYSVLVIDSISHMWSGSGGILEIVDKVASVNRDQRAGWKVATPKYERFLETVKNANMHIICTIRTKSKLLENDKDGQKVMKKVSDEPVMRDGIEYEFTTVLDIDISHLAKASKDRTGIFDTIVPQAIDERTGKLFLDWLEGKK